MGRSKTNSISHDEKRPKWEREKKYNVKGQNVGLRRASEVEVRTMGALTTVPTVKLTGSFP